MRRNGTPEGTTMVLSHGDRSRGALWGSLLLLAASFVLLVLGPMLLARFQGATQNMPAAGYLSMAAASGIALGGGAAMIAVISRLLRDLELRPYAALAPVLAVFAGFVLWGIGARLPLNGVQTEYVGVFALMVAVAGGALVAASSGGGRIAGWLFALFAPLSLMGLLWAASGKGDLGAAYWSLLPAQKSFLGMLLGSSLLLAIVGEVSRRMARRPELTAPREYPKNTRDFAKAEPQEEPLFLKPRAARAEAMPAARSYQPVLPAPNYDDFAQSYAAQAEDSSPKVNVWEMHEELELPKRFAWGKIIVVALLALAAVGAGVYYGLILPQRAREAEAAQLIEQRKQQIHAAEQAEAAQKRAAESKLAAERLEKMLAAPAPGEAAPAAAAAQPAATAQPAAAPAAP